jgi:hypothetical protein
VAQTAPEYSANSYLVNPDENSIACSKTQWNYTADNYNNHSIVVEIADLVVRLGNFYNFINSLSHRFVSQINQPTKSLIEFLIIRKFDPVNK